MDEDDGSSQDTDSPPRKRRPGTDALDRAQARRLGLSPEAEDGSTEDQFRAQLDAGYLFEFTWTEHGSPRTMIVTHDPIKRPSARPLHGPPIIRVKPIGHGE